VLRAEGLPDPVGVAGHSLGEFAALVAADAVGLRDALQVVVTRGVAMQRAGEERPGTMTALLGLGAADAERLCDEVRDDGELVRDGATLRELLGRQVVSPVRWEAGIRALGAAGATTFLEAGSGDVLTRMMKRIDATATAAAIGSPSAAREALAAST